MVGTESSSDAGIYKVSEDLAIVQSVDFFTPIVDDPYEFGQIAAANSLSDIYAVGAQPLTALNIVCFPIKTMDKEILTQILKGGLDKIHEAGAVLVGGHSVEDQEPKYGLCVTGIVHPDKFLTNSGAKPGDKIILTKPIGTGILATALKGKLIDSSVEAKMIQVMKELNKTASELMLEVGVNAVTDITGFGLVGHSLEMARASNVTITLESSKIPYIKEALSLAQMGIIPEGDYENKRFCSSAVRIKDGIDKAKLDLMFDAQTSGGLLISVDKEKADTLWVKMLEAGILESGIIGTVKQKQDVWVEIIP